MGLASSRAHAGDVKGSMRPSSPRPSTTLARVLSKRGLCSRSQAFEFIHAGRVAVDGIITRDPFTAVPAHARIELDGRAGKPEAPVYIMLNKPRGLVTTTSDEHGRATVFTCLEGSDLPRLIAVGRLDKASEGLLLLTNDTTWAARITDPATNIDKTYHVQIDAVADDALVKRLIAGIVDGGETLRAKAARILRAGEKNSWLEIVLDEGRNRHIRRMLEAHGLSVLRLVRVAIGPLVLGALAKGRLRALTMEETRALASDRHQSR